MNRLFLLLRAVATALLISAGSLHAQAAQPARLSNEIKTAVDAAPHRPVIQQFVHSQVERLQQSDNPAAQSVARDALVDETRAAPGGPEASPSYLDVYADELNRALLPLAQNSNVRVRLLAGIVTQRVAERVNNTRLVPVAERLLEDELSAVALWGMKASRHLLPQVVRQPLMLRERRLVNQIRAAVERHTGGPVVREAYEALMLDVLEPRQNIATEAVQLVVPEMLHVFGLRVEQWEASVPQEPSAENRATLFLTAGPVWRTMDEEQQKLSIALMAELIRNAGRHGEASREAARTVAQRTGDALHVAGGAMGNTQIQGAVEPVRQMGAATTSEQMRQICEEAYRAIQAAVPDLPNLRAPAAPIAPVSPEPEAATAISNGKRYN